MEPQKETTRNHNIIRDKAQVMATSSNEIRMKEFWNSTQTTQITGITINKSTYIPSLKKT